jgi:hypothetical protein
MHSGTGLDEGIVEEVAVVGDHDAWLHLIREQHSTSLESSSALVTAASGAGANQPSEW